MRGGRAPLGFLAGGIRGHYRAVAFSGLTTGLAAGDPIFAARLAGTGTNLYVRALIQRLRITAAIVTPFTAGQELYAAAYVASAWSVADSGGTPLTLTAPNAMLNDISDAPPVMTINVATTGLLTAGTRTLRTQPFLVAPGVAAAGPAVGSPFAAEWKVESDQNFPLNLQGGALWQNVGTYRGPEGIVVTNGIAQGAGGTVRCMVEMEWVEYDVQTNVGGQL